jgi:inorganic pyrophosphatase
LASRRDLTRLPHRLDGESLTCDAVVETPKGNRQKFNFDPDTGLFRLHSWLPEGMIFPTDFGFIPGTRCPDGDPMDVMIVTDQPSPTGALVEIRLLGILEAEQREKGKRLRNDRVIATARVARPYARVRSALDLDAGFLDQIGQFWINKDRLEGKEFRILRIGDPKDAAKQIRRAARAAGKG